MRSRASTGRTGQTSAADVRPLSAHRRRTGVAMTLRFRLRQNRWNGGGPVVSVDGDHNEVAFEGQRAFRAVHGLDPELRVYGHGGAANLRQPCDDLDDRPDGYGVMKIDGAAVCRHDLGATPTRGADEGCLVHPGHCLAAEQGAEVIGVRRKDRHGHARLGTQRVARKVGGHPMKPTAPERRQRSMAPRWWHQIRSRTWAYR